MNVSDITANESITLSFNVTAYIISSNATIQTLGMKKFTTLKENYQPDNITQIQLLNWLEKVDENGKAYLNMEIQWLPARDRTCSYDVVYYGNHFDIGEINVPFNSLYRFIIPKKLRYDENYHVGVRGKNTQNHTIQSSVKWLEFFSIPCESSHCNSSLQMKVLNITLNYTHLGDRLFNVTATWKTNMIPDRVNISINDADQNNHNITKDPVELNGTQSSYTFEDVLILGTSFSVRVVASIGNNNSHEEVEYRYLHMTYVEDKIDDILFYSLVVIMCLLLIALFKVWKGRIDSFISILAQKRLENMDLETVKTISKGTVLNSIEELTKDELMEVERENISMLELLGEGAFGLVKKAVMVKNGEKRYVAVKMLKSKKITNIYYLKN